MKTNKLQVFMERKVYKVNYLKENIKLTTKCYIPFGLEKFKGKYIVNLELDGNDTEMSRYITAIKTIENIFKNIKDSEVDITPRFRVDIENCIFVESIKDRNLDDKIYHHRCHIKNIKEFSHILSQKDRNNKKMMKVQINLDRVWIYDGSYGLVWNITDLDCVV